MKILAQAQWDLSLAGAIDAAVGGKTVSTLYENLIPADVVVRLPEDVRRSGPDLAKLLVAGPQGYSVPLGEIARVLKPGGVAYLSEPVYAVRFNDILKLFHDERVVREADFDAVLLRSSMSRSAVLLGQALGMSLPPFPVVNADPDGEDSYDPPKSVRKRLRQLNHLDLELFKRYSEGF